ncbi:MAG: hypothetical protein HWD58_02940 [Bacteroidota bacterium]|nr:MAG: hypothetical protein HWD58_02940 [Bacteroidota bacterium]
MGSGWLINWNHRCNYALAFYLHNVEFLYNIPPTNTWQKASIRPLTSINVRTYSKPWLHLPLQLTFSAGKFFLGAGSGFMAGIFQPVMNESFQWDTPLEASLGIEHKRFLFQLDYVRGLRPIYEAYTIFYKPANSSLFYYNSMLTLSISTRINNPGNRCEGCRNARL